MPDRDVLDHATAQRANGLTVYWVLLSETGLPPRCSNRTRRARYLTTLATSTAGAVSLLGAMQPKFERQKQTIELTKFC